MDNNTTPNNEVNLQLVAHPSVHEESYTKVYNSLIDNPDLSVDAKMLLIYLTRQMPGWVFYDFAIMKFMGCKKTKLEWLYSELKKAGHTNQVRIPGKIPGTFRGSIRQFSNRPIFKVTETPKNRVSDKPSNDAASEPFTETLKNGGVGKVGSHNNNNYSSNNNNYKTTTTVVCSLDNCFNEIVKLGFGGVQARQIRDMYSEDYINEKLSMPALRTAKTPQSFFIQALRNDWKPPITKTASADSRVDETQDIIKQIDANLALAAASRNGKGRKAWMDARKKK